MAAPDSAPSTSLSSTADAHSPSSSSSSSSIGLDEEERYGRQNPELGYHYTGILNQGDAAAADANEESFSCFAVILTFWFFVAMTLILGVYGPKNMWIGPNSSVLVELNPLFVQSIKVKQVGDLKHGLKLFGFYRSHPPPLDVIESWSETQLLSVSPNSHKGWAYYLNKGTCLNISYNVKSQDSSLLLVLAQGAEGFSKWLEDPAIPNTTLSWNLIHGSGMVKMEIPRSSSYYVAVDNLNTKDVEVELDIAVRAFLYDTTESFFVCTFVNGECTFDVMFPDGNSFVVTSSAPQEGLFIEQWYIRFSYQPRWITYIVGTGIMTGLMLVALKYWQRSYCMGRDRNSDERVPLVSNKDEGGGSTCSSYESVSDDEADLEGESSSSMSMRRLCAICFDAPRDCFFLPCGHCVSCFQCGTRIAEEIGDCPICCRRMKKVRPIYTV